MSLARIPPPIVRSAAYYLEPTDVDSLSLTCKAFDAALASKTDAQFYKDYLTQTIERISLGWNVEQLRSFFEETDIQKFNNTDGNSLIRLVLDNADQQNFNSKFLTGMYRTIGVSQELFESRTCLYRTQNRLHINLEPYQQAETRALPETYVQEWLASFPIELIKKALFEAHKTISTPQETAEKPYLNMIRDYAWGRVLSETQVLSCPREGSYCVGTLPKYDAAIISDKVREINALTSKKNQPTILSSTSPLLEAPKEKKPIKQLEFVNYEIPEASAAELKKANVKVSVVNYHSKIHKGLLLLTTALAILGAIPPLRLFASIALRATALLSSTTACVDNWKADTTFEKIMKVAKMTGVALGLAGMAAASPLVLIASLAADVGIQALEMVKAFYKGEDGKGCIHLGMLIVDVLALAGLIVGSWELMVAALAVSILAMIIIGSVAINWNYMRTEERDPWMIPYFLLAAINFSTAFTIAKLEHFNGEWGRNSPARRVVDQNAIPTSEIPTVIVGGNVLAPEHAI